MSRARNNRITALAITLATVLLLLLLLTCCHISQPSRDQEWPPHKDKGIVKEIEEEEEEYIEVLTVGSDNADLHQSDNSQGADVNNPVDTRDSNDLDDTAPQEGQVQSNITQTTESTVTETVQPDPAAEQARLEALARQREQQRRDSIANAINAQGSVFANVSPAAPASDGAPNPGKVIGSSADGGNNGQAGSGKRLTKRIDVPSSSDFIGVVTIKCIVLPGGKVKPGSAELDLSPSKSSGQAANDDDTVKGCIQITYSNTFERPEADDFETIGEITFVYK